MTDTQTEAERRRDATLRRLILSEHIVQLRRMLVLTPQADAKDVLRYTKHMPPQTRALYDAIDAYRSHVLAVEVDA